jgi:hypothetical protein
MHKPPSRARRLIATAVTAAAIGTSVLTQVAAPAGATDTFTWSIDANSVRALVQQENHDEVYVASIAFRTTPGVPGSTTATYHGHLSEINDVDVGETHGIPDAMGRVSFANVTRRSLSDVLAGHNPEVVGTISMFWESDNTRFAVIDRLMEDVADTAETEIAQAVEPLTLADLTTEGAIADRLGAAGDAIVESATPPLLRQIGIFLGSLFNPDDLIDHKVNVFVAVDGTLAPLVDAKLGQEIPASTGVGGALRPRAYNQVFTGDGGSYRVAFAVGT